MTGNGKIKFEFTAKIWQSKGNGGWHFASLPKDLSKEIRKHFQWQEEGWGRLSVAANIADMSWKTAIWYDTRKDCYLLPLKAEVRMKLGLRVKERIQVIIWV